MFNKNASSYFLKNAKALKKLTAQTEFLIISDKEDEKFIKKVHSILESSDCTFNILSKLIIFVLLNLLKILIHYFSYFHFP